MQVIATAGHVDHGKSTLVRALTGMEPDRWAEERRRGMTIDLGFAWTELAGGTVAFVDVPGHERFVSTMLAGVGPVPAVMFVVAADEGWMPQSTEHLDALSALGTRHGILVVTRSDLFDPEPALDEARCTLAASPMGELPSVCVSGTTGAGLDDLRAALAELAAGLPAPDPDTDVRLWVDRAFTIQGAGTVVTGTLPAGVVSLGDELILEPDGRTVTVRGLQSLGEPVGAATGVARVAVNLRGLSRESVRRGDVLVTPGRWLTSTELDVRLHGVRGAVDASDLPEQLSLHVGAAAVPARVRPLGRDHARLTLRTALPLRIGDRALLRDPGRQRIASGLTVLDVRPAPLRRRGSAARRAAALAGFTGAEDPSGELRRRTVVHRTELAAMGGGTPADAVPEGGGWLLDPQRAAELAEQLVEVVTEHDAAHPLDPGVPLAAAQHLLALPHPRLVDAVLTIAPASARLAAHDGRVHRVDAASDELPGPLRRARDTLHADLSDNPFAAPDAGRLAGLGLGTAELAALVRAGELIRIADGIVLLPGAEDAAVRVLAEFGDRDFTLSEARVALRTSRRVAVPLLERLNAQGHTARTPDGNHRLTSRELGFSSG
ncbi:selenocysteine-specific translation elongation factor [Pseudonocardia spinosispora]|uniref:selenocysteine-specific translation elongation factor n=1 Tax=Pseudonocardia spinosispora TaxID=103441 RepID=UPI0003F82322|nr:selenocysteine-specific translation elongation factor [Pseudonocardia spinosispora]